MTKVLNLIINGLPSIPQSKVYEELMYDLGSFKPYYKWITFNTMDQRTEMEKLAEVLNLIINGLPSIL